MTHDAVSKLMVAHVLLVLIYVASARLRSIEQRQTQCVVVRLVPTILAVVEHGHTVVAATVGEVCPLVRVHLIAVCLVVATLHTTETEVVGSLLVAHVEREVNLQQRVERVPVHLVVNVDTVGKTTLVKTNVLCKLRVTIGLCHTESFAQRAVFDELHAHVGVYIDRLLVKRGLQNLPCRPCLRLAVVKHHKTYRLACSNELFAIALVHDRRNVASLVYAEFVDRVFYCVGVFFSHSDSLTASLHTDYAETCSRHLCGYQQVAIALRVGYDL